MTERKPRKAAESEPETAQTPEPRQTPPPRQAPEFPWPDDHYVSTPAIARRSHSGGADAAFVRLAQQALGTEPNGEFTTTDAIAVGEFQQEAGLEVSRVIDRATWDALFA
jgi:hypothetical protein